MHLGLELPMKTGGGQVHQATPLLRNVRPWLPRVEARVSWLNQAEVFHRIGFDFLLFSFDYPFLRLSLRNRRDSFLNNPAPSIQPAIPALPSGPQHKAFQK